MMLGRQMDPEPELQLTCGQHENTLHLQASSMQISTRGWDLHRFSGNLAATVLPLGRLLKSMRIARQLFRPPIAIYVQCNRSRVRPLGPNGLPASFRVVALSTCGATLGARRTSYRDLSSDSMRERKIRICAFGHRRRISRHDASSSNE